MFGHTVNPISSPLVIVANPKRCVLESGGGIVAVKAAVRIVALGNTHSLTLLQHYRNNLLAQL